jgi:hypothetical protein
MSTVSISQVASLLSCYHVPQDGLLTLNNEISIIVLVYSPRCSHISGVMSPTPRDLNAPLIT